MLDRNFYRLLIIFRFDGNLSHLICRLWPFMYHSSPSVRSSTLKTIYILVEKFCSSNDLPTKNSSVEPLVINSYKETVVEKSAKNLDISNLCLKSGSKEMSENWLENVLEPLLNHTFQRGLLENVQENLNLIEKVSSDLILINNTLWFVMFLLVTNNNKLIINK